ncbi:uncharacterized protein LOC129596195 isoform X2 [Paramacrobiotus metropolitanus]|uniref:uncharacterized protein LOC129596195 isoform X2 n=1 Tax=Paramacrobiotus metropolitanus TaxID=2943436 RepID=UPI0024457238|nr:uncharacterized protein LOC129596195 isoform X2 [Paramacrobiotus metropolitanus]
MEVSEESQHPAKRLKKHDLPASSDEHHKHLDYQTPEDESASFVSAPVEDVDILSKGHFSETRRQYEDFQPTTTTFPPGFRRVVRPCGECLVRLDLSALDLNMANAFRKPANGSNNYSYFNKYIDLTTSRNTMLRKAGAAVCAAYEIAYGDQIALFSAFMASALEKGQIPYQPQASPQYVLQRVQEKNEENKTRLAQFAYMLPGFENIIEEDRKILFLEKHLMAIMLHHMKYCHQGEFYFAFPGPEDVHFNNYWIDILGVDPDFTKFLYKCTAVFNSIGLTLTETYLLLAAAFFDPGNTSASDKTLLGQLNAFYLEALLYMIGYRLDDAERPVVYRKLEEAMKIFPTVSQVSVYRYKNIDYSSLPALSRTFMRECLRR